jgi:LysR family hydrogen peroxide-inducible transcriptional activator
MKLPTTKQLRYFVALAEIGHFGRAAEASFVSQSAFSNAIRELESLLDVQLVDRTNRSVTITAMGQQIATQARLCLLDLEGLVDIAQGQRKPRALPKLRRQYPELRLYLHEGQTQRVYERLMDGELDLLLLALPYDLRGVEVEDLFRDRFALAYRKGTDRVDPENYRFSRLDADSILLLEDGHCLRDHALAACKIRNAQKVQRITASSVLTLVEMVDADLGITFLPEMARDSAILRNTKVRLHALSERSYRKIGIAWRKGSGRAEEFRMLGKYLTENR